MRRFLTRALGKNRLPIFSTSAVICAACLIFGFIDVAAQAQETVDQSGAGSQAAARPNHGVQIEGELEILQQDVKDGRNHLLYSLKQADGTRVRLQFVDEPPRHLLTGHHVRATGQLSGGSLILYSGGTTVTNTTAATTGPLPNTLGAQSTLVILVSFQDAPSNQPWTPSQIQTEVFSGSGTSGFLQEASYGQTWLTGDVYGWYVIPFNSTNCDTNQIATLANNAATQAGVNVANYPRLVYVFPYTSACAWAGAATIGGSPSQSWVNGGGTTTNTLNLGVFAHEIGHNLGLYHSHGLDCGSAIFSGQCTVWEYFDSLDVMGSGQGHYNSFQKERLGWLNYAASPPVTTVTVPGTYTVAPYEINDSNDKALKVLKFANPTTGLSYYYYIEYRQPVGFDSFISSLAAQNMTNGVVIHLAQQGAPNSSDLLNMTPQSSAYFDWNDVALAVGATYSDPDAGVTIATQSVGSRATVIVNTGLASCARALPSIALSSSQTWPVPAGATVTYTVTITNNDSSSCAASTFLLQPSIAYGWTDSLSDTQLTLNPGASVSTTLSVTSASNSNNGPNPVNVTATSSGDFVYFASASSTYSVGVPSPPTTPSLAVSTSVAGSSFVPPGAVPISALATIGGSPVSGGSVTFTLTTPNGATTTQTTTTGSNGVATWTYKLSGKSPIGMYSVVAQASLSSGGSGGKKTGGRSAATATSASSNTATFTVQ
jgi:hypothetical protein